MYAYGKLLERYRSRPVGARVTLTPGVTDVIAIHRHLKHELGFFEAGFSPVTAGDTEIFNLNEAELADEQDLEELRQSEQTIKREHGKK